MIYSKLVINFTEDLVLNDKVRFFIVSITGTNPSVNTIYIGNFVNIRLGYGQVTTPVIPVDPTVMVTPGEATAIAFYEALILDLPLYDITLDGTEITIISTWGMIRTFFYDENYIQNTTSITPLSVNVEFENNIETQQITDVYFTPSEDDACGKVSVNIESNGDMYNITSPLIDTINDSEYSFEWNRNENISIVVGSVDGNLYYNIKTPPFLNPALFNYTKVLDVLTITNNYLTTSTGPGAASHSNLLNLEYSIDNINWQDSGVFNGVDYDFTVYIRDQYGCSFSHSNTSTISSSDMILSRSPYYITYESENEFSYVEVELFIWFGDKATPSEPTFKLFSYKVKPSDNHVYLEVSDYIKSFLDPKLNRLWYTNSPVTADTTYYSADNIVLSADMTFVVGENSFNEACWVKYTIEAILVTRSMLGNTYYIVDSLDSGLKIATLGYGYHDNYNNPSPSSDILVNPVDKYSTQDSINYVTSVNPTASNTRQIINRVSSGTNNVICNGRHKEYQIVYLNKYGVWDSMLFNRFSSRTVDVSNDSRSVMQSRPDRYDIYSPTKRISNIVTKEEYILNTDLLDENQNNHMQDLFLSDRWYLLNQNDDLLTPVILVDKSFVEKRSLYDRAKIQWSVKFENANDKINNIK